MIGVFGDQNLRHHRLGRQSALDQPGRRGRLHHHLFAGPAGIFRPAHDQYAQLRGDDVEPFAAILADPVQRIAAARTTVILDVDHHLDALQMRRQRPTVHAPPGGALGPLGRSGRFTFGFAARGHLLDLF